MARRKKKPGRIGNTFKTEFSIIRLLDNKLIASMVELDVELDVDDSVDAPVQLKALESMRRWIDEIVDDSIAFCPSSDIPVTSLQTLQNSIMITPDDPYDHLLLILICAKLNAIGAGIASVTRCQLSSSLGGGFGNWFEGDTEDALPTLLEWLGERTYFDKAWWNRSDGSTIDVWASPDADINKKPDILIDLWPEDAKEQEVENAPSKIITLNFKPTIV